MVEDDQGVASAIRRAFSHHGIQLDHVVRGADVLTYVPTADVVVLDLGLPDVDGIEVCREIRQASDVPIIMATARVEVRERIFGLNCGADDYLPKPFNIDELLARLDALVRRRPPGGPQGTPSISRAGLTVDLGSCRVTIDGHEVTLGPKEYQLLAVIAAARGTVCTRKRLVAQIWGRWWSGADRTLDVNMASLRRKLGRPEAIETVRGIGYRLGTASAPGPA